MSELVHCVVCWREYDAVWDKNNLCSDDCREIQQYSRFVAMWNYISQQYCDDAISWQQKLVWFVRKLIKRYRCCDEVGCYSRQTYSGHWCNHRFGPTAVCERCGKDYSLPGPQALK